MMPGYDLIRAGEARVAGARSRLDANQLKFAEWLAVPRKQRNPSKQIAFAQQMGITEQTLCNWKKIPEIREVIDEIVGIQGRELVVEAITVLGTGMKSDNQRIALDSARDVLSRWGETTKRSSIIASLKDLYDMYHKAE